MIDSPDLIVCFFPNIVQKLVVNGVQSVPKFKLRPKQNAHFYCPLVIHPEISQENSPSAISYMKSGEYAPLDQTLSIF